MSTSAERMRRLRERRAASAQPRDDALPLDPLAAVVDSAIAALELGERDAAAAALARRYAEVMDNARDPVWATRWIGPLLLRSLEELGATPKSRPASKKPPAARANRVAELRTAHAASKRKAG